MDNNVNLVAARKKKNKRKKKNNYATGRPLPQPTNPAATLQGLKTIANLIHIHQQLTHTGQSPKYDSDNPKPLMSEPRATRPMFSGHTIPGLSECEPKMNTFPSMESESTNLGQNITGPDVGEHKFDNSLVILENGTKNENQSTYSHELQSQNKPMNSKNLTSQPDSQNTGVNEFQNVNNASENVNSKNYINNTFRNRFFSIQLKNEMLKKKGYQLYSRMTDNQFNDIEIYNNPSFLSFETTDEVVDLNDDDLNLNRSMNEPKQTENYNNLQKNIQSNFQIKLQKQYAKKLEMMNKSETIVKTIPERDIPDVQVTSQDVLKKTSNKELLEGLSCDIKAVVQDNIKSNLQDHMPFGYNTQPVFRRLPSGIPRSYLHMEKFTEPQQQNYYENPSTSNSRIFDRTQNIYESQITIQTQSTTVSQAQVYSPTDIYKNTRNDGSQEGSESPDVLDPGSKRVSAFQRLGPLSQVKKPKLTINLCLNKEQAVREVIKETQKDIPVRDREDINNSTDDIVVKYRHYWPWNKPVAIKKSVTARQSKTVMMLEKEQMEEVYDKDNSFIMVTVTGYPPSWTKEDVLDVILDNLKGKTFVPIFIEFTAMECKFFVIRNRGALISIHWLGFSIRKDDVELSIVISQTFITDKQIDFIPRLELKKRLVANYDGTKVDLSEFTLQNDVSHFIYFPLNRIYNQTELIQLTNDVPWEHLTELDLSHNRLTSLEGFYLENTTPHLKTLNLSDNYLDSVLVLLPCRKLPLKKLTLEGNPLCLDYIDPDHYVTVLRKIFSGLRELDGVEITLKGDLPRTIRNYCPEDAKDVVEKFLEVFFPLLDSERDERQNIKDLYMKNAVMTITCRSKLRYESTYKHMRNFAIKSQNFLEGNVDSVEGVANIGKLIRKWPHTKHDPTSFTTDVIHHDESTTIFQIAGILKVTAESLAEEEPLIAFSRTVVLITNNGCQYKIQNEMLNWDEPSKEYASIAFKTVMIPRKTLTLKFETTPDDITKKRLISIFMKVTELEEKQSERCLEFKNWHFQHALEYFMKLLKLDNLQSLHI